jgi:FkbM family methyltransferase
MISYSSNFEDVILQRVFADIAQGSYIDVGASLPIEESNSFALYQKGWRGIAIEPLPYRQAWQDARPEDVFLNAVAGAKAGRSTLHVYEQARRISSGSAQTVAHWASNGIQSTHTIEVPVMKLDDVIVEHLGKKPLHLLLIDVEGMEREVLAGLDLTRHRPWVLVVEATLPGTPEAAHQDWEPRLLDSGYRMAYFDAVNRFYLSGEHLELMGRFALPPNVFDHFIMARQIELEALVARLEAELETLQARIGEG